MVHIKLTNKWKTELTDILTLFAFNLFMIYFEFFVYNLAVVSLKIDAFTFYRHSEGVCVLVI